MISTESDHYYSIVNGDMSCGRVLSSGQLLISELRFCYNLTFLFLLVIELHSHDLTEERR